MRRAARWTDSTLLSLFGLALSACWSSASSQSPPREASPQVEERISRLAERRWVEPRLSAGQAYGRCVEDCGPERVLCEPKCSPPPETLDRHKVAAAVSSWLEEAAEGTAERHSEALLDLAAPETERVDRQEAAEKAVQLLETLTEESPSDARILSDLAAAYYVRAQREERPADLLRALETAEKAVGLEPQLSIALFNQALIHEALDRRPTAQRAFKLYTLLDPLPGWADEARQHLIALSKPQQSWTEVVQRLDEALDREDDEAVRLVVGQFRRAARRYVENGLLLAWADAILSDDEGRAASELAKARRMAVVLAELGGDTLLVEAVESLEMSSPARRRALAEGHRAYVEGLRQTVSREPFELARRKLAGSPFQGWAVIWLATGHYYQGEYQQALELLEALREEIEADPRTLRRHANLLGHAYWIAALSQTFLTRPLEALGSYQKALGCFEATGEYENVVNIHSRLADVLATLGEKEEAWKHRYQALRGRSRLQHPMDRAFTLIEASTAALGIELTVSAFLLEDEALALARKSQGAPVLVAGLLQHAEISRRSGKPDQTLRDLKEVAQILIDEPKLREVVSQGIVRAGILEVESDVQRSEDPRRSAEILTEALQNLSTDPYLSYLARLLLKRAEAYLATGQLQKASADIEASAAALEKEWEQVLAARRRGEHEEIWPAYFVHRRETFDLGIKLLAERGEAEHAFGYAERARARELLDLVAHLPSKSADEEPLRPRTAEAVREALPDGQLLVEFALLEDRLLIWELRHEHFELHVQDVSRARIEGLLAQIDSAMNERDANGNVDGALVRLHELLLGPFLAGMKAGEEIVFVPDGPLHGVPFAALRSATSGRYLIEDHVLSVAPSATLYLFSLRRNRELQRTAVPTALLVGDPAFDRELLPGLPDLPDAVSEVQQIALYYPGSLRLEETDATKPRLLAELGRYDIFHFAGHATPEYRSPYRSALVLAPSAGEPGILYAEELLRQDLGRTRLVVLSACSTAGGKAIGSLTLAGLVRPLLGAGVPAVVGTLWDVNTVAAFQLLDEFHLRLSEGESAAGALRLAQLKMIRGNIAQRLVKSWAPFQVIGAVSFNESESRERKLP